MKIKHTFIFLFKFYKQAFTYRLHAHTGNLQKQINHMENPVLSPFVTPPPYPCIFFLFLSFFFQNVVADENKYSGLGIPEN